ncbi:hypothetical protein AVEN_89119-1 [Araneus ventricosus]|uniref:Uncharacterized protein n=1 Tax=Araneus ventricosus TaxID=182803 RepID=A0A4Y2B4T2_ARAVE|nr:hypothetical protein AVEN_89119-1 [Araneus ventricosus]
MLLIIGQITRRKSNNTVTHLVSDHFSAAGIRNNFHYSAKKNFIIEACMYEDRLSSDFKDKLDYIEPDSTTLGPEKSEGQYSTVMRPGLLWKMSPVVLRSTDNR